MRRSQHQRKLNKLDYEEFTNFCAQLRNYKAHCVRYSFFMGIPDSWSYKDSKDNTNTMQIRKRMVCYPAIPFRSNLIDCKRIV